MKKEVKIFLLYALKAFIYIFLWFVFWGSCYKLSVVFDAMESHSKSELLNSVAHVLIPILFFVVAFCILYLGMKLLIKLNAWFDSLYKKITNC